MLTIRCVKAPDDPAVVAVKELIDAIGEVTLESGDAIDAAAPRQAARGQEGACRQLREADCGREAHTPGRPAAAKAVDDLIDAIGEVTLRAATRSRLPAPPMTP